MVHDGIKQADVIQLAVNEVSFFRHDLNEAVCVGTLRTSQMELSLSVFGCPHNHPFIGW